MYRFEFRFDSEIQSPERYSRMVFSDYQSCLAFVRKELDACSDDPVLTVNVDRQCIASDARISVVLDKFRNLEVISCSREGEGCYDQSDPDREIPFIFYDLWFCFPSPFSKGDIVWCRDPHYGRVDGPLVLQLTTPMRCAERPGYRGIDYTDMYVGGYYLGTDGLLYYDVNPNYMNYEYFPQERLTGRERVLKALSSFLKNRISVDLLINSYISTLLTEIAGDTEFSCTNVFGEDYLKIAGIKPENSEEEK